MVTYKYNIFTKNNLGNTEYCRNIIGCQIVFKVQSPRAQSNFSHCFSDNVTKIEILNKMNCEALISLPDPKIRVSVLVVAAGPLPNLEFLTNDLLLVFEHFFFKVT